MSDPGKEQGPIKPAAWKFMQRKEVGRHPELGPLFVRWTIFRCPWFGIMLHKLCRSDIDRAFHDHPWAFVSIILKGGYDEVIPRTQEEAVGNAMLIYQRFEAETESFCLVGDLLGDETLRVRHRPGAILRRPAEWQHRVIIEGQPSWNLLFIGPRQRWWGFWNQGLKGPWCHWKKYDSSANICAEQNLWEDGED